MDFTFVDMTDISNIENAITSSTKLIWIETPTNPMLNIVDIAAVCALAKKYNLLVCVVGISLLLRICKHPLDRADIVIHSATKYLGGHSDVIHGAIVVKDKTLADQLYFKCMWCGTRPAGLFLNPAWYPKPFISASKSV